MNSGQRQGNDGAELDILFIAGGIFILALLFLYFFQTEIIHFVFMIKSYELKLIVRYYPQYTALQEWIATTPDQKVTMIDLVYVLKMIGMITRYPIILIAIIFSVIIFIFHRDRLYSDIESMDSLSDKMRLNFPASQIVHGLKLHETPLDEGPWASAETPIEFAKKHRLIYRDPVNRQVQVRKPQAKAVFARQLGPVWKGVQALTPPQKALFAALCAYINYSRTEAELFLDKISLSVTAERLQKKRLDYSGTDALLKKYMDSPAVNQIIQSHAYVFTIFISMLIQARKTGIVANSSYLWMKPLDRSLWYVLNNVGRKAVFSETAGVHAHWLAEKAIQYPIEQPMIDETISALEEAIQARIINEELPE